MALAVALLRRAHQLTSHEALDLLDLDGDGLARLVDAVLTTVAVTGTRSRPEDDLISPTGVGDA